MVTVPSDSPCSKEQCAAGLEALEAVRLVSEAMLTGAWTVDPDVIDGLMRLLMSTRQWAERAAA